MISIKRKMAAVAVATAMAVSGGLPAFAAPIGGSAAMSVAQGQTLNNQSASDGVTLVGKRNGGRGWKGGGKSWKGGGWNGNRHSFNGNRRWRGRGHNNNWWVAPLVAAPFIYGGLYSGGYYDDDDYSYGSSFAYGGGNSCYQECRYEHGPRYCRAYWRRYC